MQKFQYYVFLCKFIFVFSFSFKLIFKINIGLECSSISPSVPQYTDTRKIPVYTGIHVLVIHLYLNCMFSFLYCFWCVCFYYLHLMSTFFLVICIFWLSLCFDLISICSKRFSHWGINSGNRNLQQMWLQQNR